MNIMVKDKIDKSIVTKRKFRLKHGLITERIEGSLTVFNGENSEIITFNRTAQEIFRKIKSGWTVIQIARYLCRKYKASEEIMVEDIRELIRPLIDKKILL